MPFVKVNGKRFYISKYMVANTGEAQENVPSFVDDDEEEDMMSADREVQYARNGNGYTPTGKTIKKLPAGVYKLEHQGKDFAFVLVDQVTDDILRLPDSKSEMVVQEILRFWGLKKNFDEFGINYKRGFLLHGPPGSGKTATVQIIIQDMIKQDGVIVLGQNPEVLKTMLRRFRNVEPNRPLVIVLEDLDAIVEEFDESAVLSILDGEEQVDNVVYIATSNYPEKLDDRITNRPSRFDRVEKIGLPNEDARSLFISHKVGERLDKEQVKEWTDATKNMSIAHIKELIISVFCFGNDYNEALERLHKMKTKPSSTTNGGELGFAKDN